MSSLRQERRNLNKTEKSGPKWNKFAATFFIGYGIVYLIVFVKKLFFSSLTIEDISSLYLRDLDSSYIFSIIAGTIIFMFGYGKLQLRHKERILFDQLPNLFMLRMILYTCLYFLIILSLLGIHLIFTTLFIQRTGGSLNLSYSLFYWAVVFLVVDRVSSFFLIVKRRTKQLIFLPFILFYFGVLIVFKFQPSYQLVFQFIGNGLVMLMFGLLLVEKYRSSRSNQVIEEEESEG
ncbi:hypothetical protein [Pseudalkalibacillus berkeleyi]|uniref:Uncharacterized protein n=1 Tax=Pseudalkalibacillus berkeleyi TaxID=1069813 RepID=A0ABS9GTM7_9BACL|nr:hypothetical protein [Pseudalkalibacillus berkeleyi]MCF6136197.1 hypothetical protein [Pseudalkalibacillus berkeleyi]